MSQLNEIPAGFNNNILWNAAHVVATMDILIYSSSGTRSSVDPNLVTNYKKGTSPGDDKDKVFIDNIKSILITSLDELKADCEKEVFGSYNERVTSYGVKLTTLENAISFNNVHEGMHYGQIKMLQRLVS